MGTLFAILVIPLLALAWHPKVTDHHGHCVAKPGSYKALLCPVKKP